jgi:hypothetical protein
MELKKGKRGQWGFCHKFCPVICTRKIKVMFLFRFQGHVALVVAQIIYSFKYVPFINP